MVNDCDWYCEECNENFCEHCETPELIGDGYYCEECAEKLRRERDSKTK